MLCWLNKHAEAKEGADRPQPKTHFSWAQATTWMVALCVAIPISAVGFTQWAEVRQAEVEAALKRDMLDRGMSAADIERVLKAPRYSNRRYSTAMHNRHAAEHLQIDEDLANFLAQRGFSGDQIARVVQASRDGARPSVYTAETVRKARDEAAFKKSLVQHGLNAEEVEQVITVMAEHRGGRAEAASNNPRPAREIISTEDVLRKLREKRESAPPTRKPADPMSPRD